MTTDVTTTSEPGVFGPDELDGLADHLDRFGYATLRGLLDEAATAAIETECVAAQNALIDGDLDDRYGTTVLIEGDAGEKANAFANYVTHVHELSPAVLETATHPTVIGLMHRWVGDGAWLMDEARFGVVYQDARPGRESSYTRIGWHSDWQSGPNIDMWPSVAFTIHIDGTSPANGFLRVVPGSHRWATPAPYRNANDAAVPEGSAPWGGHTDAPAPFEMPLGFEKVPGEIAVYAERGDILFHDAYLWHSAARATDDDTRRRHVRGGWFSGTGPLGAAHVDDFVKNAAR
jgi:hypothetical protein